MDWIDLVKLNVFFCITIEMQNNEGLFKQKCKGLLNYEL